MNNERIAVSEFQTWNQEVFGELMNVMANGSFTMQKGQVDTKREGKVNFMFLGNLLVIGTRVKKPKMVDLLKWVC